MMNPAAVLGIATALVVFLLIVAVTWEPRPRRAVPCACGMRRLYPARPWAGWALDECTRPESHMPADCPARIHTPRWCIPAAAIKQVTAWPR